MTDSMEESLSWEANMCTPDQEIQFMAFEGYYYFYESLPLVHIQSQVNQLYAIQFCLLDSHFNIILPSVPRFSKQFLCFRFSNENPVSISLLLHACHLAHTSRHLRFHDPNSIW
jgi:hypothetical protein